MKVHNGFGRNFYLTFKGWFLWTFYQSSWLSQNHKSIKKGKLIINFCLKIEVIAKKTVICISKTYLNFTNVSLILYFVNIFRNHVWGRDVLEQVEAGRQGEELVCGLSCETSDLAQSAQSLPRSSVSLASKQRAVWGRSGNNVRGGNLVNKTQAGIGRRSHWSSPNNGHEYGLAPEIGSRRLSGLWPPPAALEHVRWGPGDYVRGRDSLYTEEARKTEGCSSCGEDDLEDTGEAPRPRVPGVQGRDQAGLAPQRDHYCGHSQGSFCKVLWSCLNNGVSWLTTSQNLYPR